MRIIIATANRGKLTEIAAILADPCLELAGLADLPPFPPAEEAGETFADNALLKAQTAAYHAGGWALADDSGLVVPALGGRPGVLSARFAGPGATDADNVAKLLRLMDGLPDDRRQAEFVCNIALVGTNNRAYFSEGRLPGTIAREPRGSNGFGYDPVFRPVGGDLTLAQIPAGEKNSFSHRAAALRRIKPLLLMLAKRESAVC